VAYSTADAVKPILQIAVEDITFDDELEACIASADALIDGLLKKADLTVPASVPQLVVDASSYFAAWLFRHRRDPAAAEVFWVEAHKFLDVYVAGEEDIPFLVGESTVD
jgi:hypothetical protein